MSLKPFRERLQRIEATLAARPSPDRNEGRLEGLTLSDEIAIGLISDLSARIANALAVCPHRPSNGTCAICVEGDEGIVAAWQRYASRLAELDQAQGGQAAGFSPTPHTTEGGSLS